MKIDHMPNDYDETVPRQYCSIGHTSPQYQSMDGEQSWWSILPQNPTPQPHLYSLLQNQHDDVPFPRTLQTTSRRQPPMLAIDDTRWIMKTASTYANRGGEVDESGGGWNNNILVHRPNLYSAWTPITHSMMIMQWRYTFSQHTTPLKATTYTAEVSGVAEANTASIIRYEEMLITHRDTVGRTTCNVNQKEPLNWKIK